MVLFDYIIFSLSFCILLDICPFCILGLGWVQFGIRRSWPTGWFINWCSSMYVFLNPLYESANPLYVLILYIPFLLSMEGVYATQAFRIIE